MESDRDPIRDLDVIEAELAAYADQIPPMEDRVPLMERPRVVVLNKVDMPDAADMADFVRADLEGRGLRVFEVSALARRGLRELGFALASIVEEIRAADIVPQARPIIRPVAQDEGGFTITAHTKGGRPFYQIRGRKPERWVNQTDFSNDEAVGYLADRLNLLGVEKELMKMGAKEGDTVVIGPVDGGVIFDWEPTISTGAELLSPRGTDARLEQNTRATRRERKAAFHERMDAKEAARQELWMDRESGMWTDPGQE